MKVYRVKVNGKVYEVELEKVEEKAGVVSDNVKPSSVNTTGKTTIDSPLQGKIFKLNVQVGDTVKPGDVVAIIEAMKMENEVQTSSLGTVKEILVGVGSEVETDQPLIVVE